MKKLIAGLLVGLFIFGSMTFVSASNEITVMVLDQKVTFDQSPIIENGRTLVPLRAIFEALNAEVFWDETTQTITAKKDTAFQETIIVKLQIGSSEMIVHRTDWDESKIVMLDVPAKIINGRTLVPVRAISESMECDVLWIPTSSTVVITPFDEDETLSTNYTQDGKLDSISILNSEGKIIEHIVYSPETGRFEYMVRYQYNYGENTRNVTVHYADGSSNSYEEEYYEN